MCKSLVNTEYIEASTCAEIVHRPHCNTAAAAVLGLRVNCAPARSVFLPCIGPGSIDSILQYTALAQRTFCLSSRKYTALLLGPRSKDSEQALGNDPLTSSCQLLISLRVSFCVCARLHFASASCPCCIHDDAVLQIIWSTKQSESLSKTSTSNMCKSATECFGAGAV